MRCSLPNRDVIAIIAQRSKQAISHGDGEGDWGWRGDPAPAASRD
jgi:hypothetical protein